MFKFALRKIEAIYGKMVFYELMVGNFSSHTWSELSGIEQDSAKGQLDKFRDELSGTTYLSKLDGVMFLMEKIAKLEKLPQTQFHPLKGAMDEFEFKRSKVRVYGFSISGGKVIVLGGCKNSQSKDITEFRKLKKQYLEELS